MRSRSITRTCRFVMCHVGNPWMIDAAEVIYKNMNVWADLSGLMVGDGRGVRVGGGARGRGGTGPRDPARDPLLRAAQPLPLRHRLAARADGRVPRLHREAVPPEYHEQVFEENARVLFRV